MYERELAEIKDVTFGIEDHGLFVLNIGFKSGDWEQSIGGLCIETAKNGVKGAAPGLTRMLRDIFSALNVQSLSGMRGKPAYVLRDDSGLIRGIESTGIAGQPLGKRVVWEEYF